MKKLMLLLFTLCLIGCHEMPGVGSDGWLEATRLRLDADPHIVMQKEVLWMRDEHGNKAPLLDGRLVTTVDGKKVERDFSLSYHKVDGKWTLEHAGFVGSETGDAALNAILADIYGREAFQKAGMLQEPDARPAKAAEAK